ncbi:MAG: ABC transporter substrate-binding protein [Pelobium sp.]
MKLIYRLFLIFFIGIGCNINAKATTQDTIRLQLKWRHQFQFSGYYAAQIKGFYKEEGLNVKILEGGPDISPVHNILDGKADIGVFDSNVLLSNSAKKPLVVLANIMQSSAYCILSLKSKNILKPSDLVGKSILVQEDQGWSIFKTILLKEGVKSEQVTVIPRSEDSKEIITRKADAVVTYVTSQPQRIREMGYKVNIIRPVEYGVDFYGDVIFSTKAYAYEDTKRTNAFIKASLKGWEYALKHEDEIIDYILTLPGVKYYGNNKSFLKYEAYEVKKLVMPDLVSIGHSNLGRWQFMLNIYKKLGLADHTISLKGFIYNPEEELQIKWLKPFIYAFAIIVLIIIVISMINWHLRKVVRLRTIELRKEIEIRKRAEIIANDHNDRIELILRSANIGLWEWDLRNNQKTFSNQLYDLLNIDKDSLHIDFEPFSVIHPDDLEKVQEKFKQNINGENRQESLQFRIKNKKGEYINVLSSSKIIMENDVPIKLSGVIIDIENIKRKEKELIKISEELMMSNNELKKFAYITSHNLRGPVVNISSLFNLIDICNINGENRIFLEKIGISINKLEDTLNDLIEVVSHQQPGHKALTLIDFEKDINNILPSIENQILESGAIFTTDFKVRTMFYSKHYFESIMINLITNAIKYRKDNTPLLVNIKTEENEDFVILKVSDNGIGIDMLKNEAKLFGLYQRFHPKKEGKGIGLFVIKSHIDSLNGKITVDSELGVGTTFTIYFSKKISAISQL